MLSPIFWVFWFDILINIFFSFIFTSGCEGLLSLDLLNLLAFKTFIDPKSPHHLWANFSSNDKAFFEFWTNNLESILSNIIKSYMTQNICICLKNFLFLFPVSLVSQLISKNKIIFLSFQNYFFKSSAMFT